MSAADHGEAVGRREIARSRNFGDRLLAGIDEIRIFFALVGEWPEAQHAILTLQLHAYSWRNVIGNQRGNADAEVDIDTIAQLLGGAVGHLLACPGHQTSSPVPAGAAVRLRVVRCSMCLSALATCTMRFTN